MKLFKELKVQEIKQILEWSIRAKNACGHFLERVV